MKNLFKLSFLALAIGITVSACDSSKKADGEGDSTAVDSSMMSSDGSMMMDSTAMDSTSMDSTKM